MAIKRWDAIVVGSGPNGIAAAITLARAGKSVLVKEAASSLGGGLKTEALTLPGFAHDLCASVFPMAVASPFFRDIPLEKNALRWIEAPIPLSQTLEEGKSVSLFRSLEDTAESLKQDGKPYLSLFKPLVRNFSVLLDEIFQPMLHIPKHPFILARFGLKALVPAERFCLNHFVTPEARALFSGIAAHSTVPLNWRGTSAIGLVLGAVGHSIHWPIVEGGAGAIASAMISYLRSLGGELETDSVVKTVAELPPSKVVFFDLTPRQIVEIASQDLPDWYTKKLSTYRYGTSVFKVDYALDGPIPWLNDNCRKASTVHVSNGFEETLLSESEETLIRGRTNSKPFLILVQPSLFDSTRAPQGKHTAWAYCHLPNAGTQDMSEMIDSQIERFAPGFKRLILKKAVRGPQELERQNPNLVGGDISGGLMSLSQLLSRPILSTNPYATPNPKLWICSSSTPPGGGVHGMSGYLAALHALKKSFD